MLAREHWVRVPELTAAERSGLFAMEDALYGCYLRVADPRSWAGPWAGIARLEMPSGIGRAAAIEAAERAAGWLPGFASALRRDAASRTARKVRRSSPCGRCRCRSRAAIGVKFTGARAVLERNREGRTVWIADCPPPAHRGRQRCRISEPFARTTAAPPPSPADGPCGAPWSPPPDVW